jgi:rhodanese-related sulfurtransferase
VRVPPLSLNQKLAGLALALGVVGIAATPYQGTKATIDTRALAVEIAREADHVEPLELAGWIVEGRSDYRLIDIRTPAEFAAYHVPTAENVPLATLVDAPLGRNETIVLYSEGGIHAAQAWLLLRARGFKAVYTLRGALEGWKDEVLFPVLAEQPSPVQAQRDAKLRAISAHFGGTPHVGGATARPQARELPRVEAPAGVTPGAMRPAKKRKEGC